MIPNLTTSVRAILKDKWMNNDHTINMELMKSWSGADEKTLIEIIHQYESELLVTKFIIQ